ncbi:hypothetical protein Xmau_02155 [Xenorhabdus mauleonii]|uniref:Uncharacterized protein n=1 Tax=Xenorhabdus mauleonii TaxID=351675 RepID=A0A1I3QGZ2_9GAMM|nr:DUF6058 family natural product biosynthesis protein [Xenorhabdus mauleonii]PHM39971.1 hypothetical protein Xmau_02155 [Xenorhabdus mauleonii]SFJ32985.1 hypothetical protein SAMN05421680_107153 [Xenorhabdus mauleonii]
MNIIDAYLSDNFILEQDFLSGNACSLDELVIWQKNKIFPLPSYITENIYSVISFFGEHNINKSNKWYAKGLCDWVNLVREYSYDHNKLKNLFFYRYENKIKELQQLGIYDNETDYSQVMEEAWNHFLDGTYGVCTKDNSPEQIAVKGVAIRVIDRITEKQLRKSIPESDMNTLITSVNLLDEVSSMFAPHERERSSRKRCIELVRSKYLI